MKDVKTDPKVLHATCVVERSFAKPPKAVFRALGDPDKVRQWMGSGRHSELIEFQCDFGDGGKQLLKYRMGPETPIANAVITNEGRFQYIVTNERIVTASTMKMNDRIISVSQVTFELLPTQVGTDLIVTHQGAFFEGSDGPAMREQGWNTLADKLVEVVGQE